MITQNLKLSDKVVESIDEIESWADNQYIQLFSPSFTKVYEMYDRLRSDTYPITDTELQWVLTILPLELFTISESLNNLRVEKEVITLEEKQMKIHLTQSYNSLNPKPSSSEISNLLALELYDYDIAVVGYNTLISRVENQISFSKELIMGCKKIWDARRNTETTPIAPVNAELPEYKI